jgi:hypothetical protein
MTNRRMGCREEAKEEVRESIRVGFRKLKMRMVVENTMLRKSIVGGLGCERHLRRSGG